MRDQAISARRAFPILWVVFLGNRLKVVRFGSHSFARADTPPGLYRHVSESRDTTCEHRVESLAIMSNHPEERFVLVWARRNSHQTRGVGLPLCSELRCGKCPIDLGILETRSQYWPPDAFNRPYLWKKYLQFIRSETAIIVVIATVASIQDLTTTSVNWFFEKST